MPTGKEGTGGNVPSSYESGSDDRIAHILSEANQALQHARSNSSNHHNSANNNNNESLNDENRAGSKSPGNSNHSSCNNMNTSSSNSNNNNSSSNNNNGSNNGCNNNAQCPSPPSSMRGERRFRKYENDDIPQEQVNRIYHEELAKLVGLRLPPGTDDPRMPREHFQR